MRGVLRKLTDTRREVLAGFDKGECTMHLKAKVYQHNVYLAIDNVFDTKERGMIVIHSLTNGGIAWESASTFHNSSSKRFDNVKWGCYYCLRSFHAHQVANAGAGSYGGIEEAELGVGDHAGVSWHIQRAVSECRESQAMGESVADMEANRPSNRRGEMEASSFDLGPNKRSDIQRGVGRSEISRGDRGSHL